MQLIRLILILMLVSSCSITVAQKHDYNWVFGNGVGLDFNTEAEHPIFFHFPVRTAEHAGSFSDVNGNLRIAFSGIDVDYGGILPFPFGREHFRSSNTEFIPFKFPTPSPFPDNKYPLSSGDSIQQYDTVSFSLNDGMLFLPHTTSSDTVYCVTYFDVPLPNQSGSSRKLGYLTFTFDASGNINSVEPFKTLGSPQHDYHERLSAIRHANGKDWWIIALLNNSSTYNILHFLDGKVKNVNSFSVEMRAKSYQNQDLAGDIVIHPLGIEFMTVFGGGGVFIHSFDRCKGVITSSARLQDEVLFSPVLWPMNEFELSMFSISAAYSPSGNLIYTNTLDSVYQWHRENGEYVKTPIWGDQDSLHRFWNLNLAPNNKIYLSISSYKYYHYQLVGVENVNIDTLNHQMASINYPDSIGQTCDFELEAIIFPLPYGNGLNGGLPHYPNYRLGKLEPPEDMTIADTSVCPDSALQIGLEEVVPFAYEWAPIAGLSCTDCANPWLVASTTQDYIVTATTECTEPKSDTVTITVLPEDHPQCKVPDTIVPPDTVTGVFIPNIITPNGDGINEVFQPSGDFESYQLTVFDRVGRMVFGGHSAWHPTPNMPEGVYFYTFELMQNGNRLQRSGSVTLLR